MIVFNEPPPKGYFMNVQSFIKTLENWFHSLVSDLKPALDYAESKGGQAVLQLAEGVLAGAAVGTPWVTLIAGLIPAAEQAGITLLEGDASIILNLAKANLDAKAAIANTIVVPVVSAPVAESAPAA